jgi:hypothetical protein
MCELLSPTSTVLGRALDSVFTTMDDSLNQSVPTYTELLQNAHNDQHDQDDGMLTQSYQTQSDSMTYDKLQTDLHGLPKHEFVDKLMQMTSGDDNQIGLYKNYLAVQARSVDGCPSGSLIHRKSTEKSTSVWKNAQDCYILFQFMCGESAEIEKVFSKQSKSISSSQPTNQAACIESSAMSIVTAVQAELTALKSSMLSLSNEVIVLRKENSVLRSRVDRIESSTVSKFTQVDAVQKQQSETINDLDATMMFEMPLAKVTTTVDKLQAMHGALAKRFKEHVTQSKENAGPRSSPSLTPKSPEVIDNKGSPVQSHHAIDPNLVRVYVPPSDVQLCVVCHKEAGGAHRCDVCDHVVHAICGIFIGEEGYGATVRCNSCAKLIYSNMSNPHLASVVCSSSHIACTGPIVTKQQSPINTVPKTDTYVTKSYASVGASASSTNGYMDGVGSIAVRVQPRNEHRTRLRVCVKRDVRADTILAV